MAERITELRVVVTYNDDIISPTLMQDMDKLNVLAKFGEEFYDLRAIGVSLEFFDRAPAPMPPRGPGPCHCDGSGHNRGHVFKGYMCKSDVHVPCPDHEVRP